MNEQYKVLDCDFDWDTMLNSSNANYVDYSNYTLAIRCDFVGGTGTGTSAVPTAIALPANVTLQFEGGSFSAMTITGNNTKIVGPFDTLFDTSVTLNGTFVADTFFPEWFGAVGDGMANDYKALNTACQLSDHVTLRQSYSIETDDQIVVRRSGSFTLVGYNSIVTNDSETHLIEPVFQFQDLDDLTIQGLTINGNKKMANAIYVWDIDKVTIEDVTIFDLEYHTGAQRTVAIRVSIENPSIVYGNNLHIHDISGGLNGAIGDPHGVSRAIYCDVNQTDTAKTKVTFENSCFEWVYGDDGDVIHIVDENYISDALHRFIFTNCIIRYATRRLVKGSASGIQYYNCKFDSASKAALEEKMGPSIHSFTPSGGVNFRNENPASTVGANFRNMHGKMINCEYRNTGNLNINSGTTLIAAYTDGLEIRGNTFYDSIVRFQDKTSNFIVDNNQFYNSNIYTNLIRNTSDPAENDWEAGISYITNNYGTYTSAGSDHPALIDVKNDLVAVVISNNKVYSVENNSTTVGFFGLLRHTRVSGTTNIIIAKDVIVSGNEIIRINSARKEYIIVSGTLPRITWDSKCRIIDNYFSVEGQAYVGANFTNGNAIFGGLYWNNKSGDGNEIGIY